MTRQLLAGTLTRQMREASHDPNLEVVYSASRLPNGPPPGTEDRYRAAMQQSNCTFEKLEMLAHNIGYVKLNSFPDPAVCRSTAVAAMARLEGANFWQTLRHIHWPQASAQAAAAWYVTYLLCLWDVETLILIVPPGGESLSLRIFNLLHYGHNPQVNALCLLLLVLALLPLLVAAALAWAASSWREIQMSRLAARAMLCASGRAE